MRSNDLAADALQELADLIAISGGDPYRVRSYEKAARSVAGYPLDLDTLDRKGLLAIPAIGAHTADKLLELRQTGRIAALEELHAQLPAGLRALLGIPGLGPKRAHQVYVELGISSMLELFNALHDEQLRHLKGWGETSERNLARAIRQMQEVGGRMPLAIALDIAEDLVAQLAALPQVSRVEYAGSLRRMRDTVGDIDLLVAADEDPAAVMEQFCTLPLTDRVLVRGPTKSSVVTTKGIQVDLRVVPAKVWGAALQYFTGSKAHNIRIRELAVRAGLKLSEYGLFRVDNGQLVASTDEADIYSRLGLPWIPPVLREDRGEVEAALGDDLPDLVEVHDIVGDLHVHTNLTDGLAGLDKMVAAASRRGYRYCAITDHAPQLAMQRMTRDKALQQRGELPELARRHDIELLHGSELNIAADGSLDWDDDFLAGFDVLVASVHSDLDQTREEMTRRLLAAIEHPYVNIIGHPTTRVLGRRPPVDFDADAVFAAAARTHTALEINAFPDRLDLSDGLVSRARKYGVVFAIDTDAHAVPHLDYLRYGVAVAQRGWVSAGEVINSWPLDRLRAFLAKGRRLADNPSAAHHRAHTCPH
ncbi:DNA polymerase/3'-5' exonuclease PolX [Mycobacterium haemophilum]|uniref:Phosphoesterase n=1 Tax=Mycobacterium haemophilum TaxID=29311 RepID=A0A0I9UP58_9MYCO|nr:DNA polymerase/3'-5' exonuclease PolX [Mycobacterium haemophilum]KLO32346.1 phosphoesterase [Mycobacterium haemophilum]KLO38559.1 phosphoesterase [Mycobacterium haemophilum]KLO44894.1 phosphoesterase [Mycobacterium haemophilum]KLO56236.1 phosphoesterase [Mycobacterium haemophilum]